MQRLIRISDPDDPRIAAFRDIRERDLVGREGRFVAEGRVVLNVLLSAARYETEAVLLLENRVGGLDELLPMIPDHVPVYVADAATMDGIAGFHIHRGILAIGRRPAQQPVADLLSSLPENALVVALAGISNHDNMGAIFRNAAAFGADAVVLDPTSCDPFYRKAIRVSVGAILKTPFATATSLDDMIGGLSAAGFQILALSPRGEMEIGEAPASARTALLLGSEGHGLPADLMSRLTTVRIPIAEDFDSLNVAAASAVALHRLWRG
ncbi:TrmH family RNA methyltransferase [Mesorhizobium australicum]|uniref:tRNA G18 (Ribose-2'-O)-methylase SpoU n=1 Tax=Mesorhizobium australicum TaxID=536018 RepID=A0A1X7PIY0_9HYPH|nr:RNA methyltransferase [Mesorhizobium australicum]SMH51590.1 tRNA G18 (ribose-2'-O)-methylase SpoU [Mesorhizobium australicum]